MEKHKGTFTLLYAPNATLHVLLQHFSFSIHSPFSRLLAAVVRPAGGTDKTGGSMPLSLNHAPANGTNYRIFHGIRYLRCVVRAVRAATEHSNRQVFANRMRLRQQSLRFAAAGMRRTAVICSAYFRVSPPAAPEVPLGTRADRCPSSIGLLLQPVGRAPDGFQPSGGRRRPKKTAMTARDMRFRQRPCGPKPPYMESWRRYARNRRA